MMVAGFTISTAMTVHKYFDTLADQLLNLIAYRTLRSASKMNKFNFGITALYFSRLDWILLILVVIVLTMGV